jgi:hypothetical protein
MWLKVVIVVFCCCCMKTWAFLYIFPPFPRALVLQGHITANLAYKFSKMSQIYKCLPDDTKDGDQEGNESDCSNWDPTTKIPKPTILEPSGQSNIADKGIEKFMMIYTCKKCNGRNVQMVAKIAYTQGKTWYEIYYDI